jgi:hypothetical protein
MKRLLVGSITALGILSGFAACGKAPVACEGDSLTEAAQACADRAGLGFSREFGSGTLIGTAPQDTLAIRNGGLADLSITSATVSGDSAFTLTTVPDTFPATIQGNTYFYMRVVFTPTQPKLYTAKITVSSNAQNFPTREFDLSGCGIPADGGSSPCYRDGGM